MAMNRNHRDDYAVLLAVVCAVFIGVVAPAAESIRDFWAVGIASAVLAGCLLRIVCVLAYAAGRKDRLSETSTRTGRRS